MAWEGDCVSLCLYLEGSLNKPKATRDGKYCTVVQFACAANPNFIMASIAAALELFMGWFLHQPFPIVPRLHCGLFRGEQRLKRGQGLVTDSNSSLWWNKRLPGPQAAGKSRKVDYYFPWMTIFPTAVLVSFSFCKVHTLNDSAKVEYFKKWSLLLSPISLNNPDGYWDKSALSVHFFCMSSFFPWIFFLSIFLFLKY